MDDNELVGHRLRMAFLKQKMPIEELSKRSQISIYDLRKLFEGADLNYMIPELFTVMMILQVPYIEIFKEEED